MPADVLDLLRTAPQPAMAVDPYAAITTARVARRRRRRAMGGVAALTFLVVAVVVGRDVGGDRTLRVAPTPGPSPSWVQPDSAAVFAVTPSSGQAPEFESVRVRYDPGTRVATFELRPGGGAAAVTATLGLTRGVNAAATVLRAGTASPVLLKLEPIDQARGEVYTVVWPLTSREAARWAAGGDLPGVMMRAEALGLHPGEETRGHVGVRLAPRLQPPTFSDGSTVHSAVLRPSGERVTAWVNPSRGLWAVGGPLPESLPAAGTANGLARGGGLYDLPGDGTWGFRLYGLLPVGAKDIAPLAAHPGAMDHAVSAVLEGDGRVAFVLDRMMPGATPRTDPPGGSWPGSLTGVAWTDTAGERRQTLVETPG